MPVFSLFSDQKSGAPTLRRWVKLAVITLALSGIGPLILLAGRASSFAETELIKSLFHEALVVHVDLSVLAWFLAILLLFWALLTGEKPARIPYVRGSAAGCFLAGVLAIAIAPLLGNGEPLMSNYIPVYTSPLFFAGLSLLLSAILLGMIDLFTHRPAFPKSGDANAIARFGVAGSLDIVLVSLICFGWAFVRLQESGITPGTQDYYEVLFWGGGHVLQLAYTQLLLAAWLWLAASAGLHFSIRSGWLWVLFLFYPVLGYTSLIAFMGDSTPYDLHFFTMQMRHGGGVPLLLLGILLLPSLVRAGFPAGEHRLAWVCFITSAVVFATGEIIGYMIADSNTIIPAHYHGSIVGTTVAFMGVVYLLLPKLGWADVRSWKSAIWQPILYGGGSVLHAVGLALAGGHGVQRKTVGALEDAHAGAEAPLQVMRLGGLLAVIGGALFIVVVFRAMRKKG